MLGLVDEFLDLVEIRRIDQRQRVFLRVDGAILKRGEDFAEGHRRRCRAKRFPGLDEKRHVRHPQLQPAQIVRRHDLLVRGQVARTTGEIGDGADLGTGNDLGLDLLADLARGDLVHLFQRVIGVRHGQQRRHRRPVLQAFAGDGHVGGAKLHAVDQVDFLAKRLVGENLHLDPALGQAGDILGEFQRGLVPAVFLVREVAELQRDLGSRGFQRRQ